MNRIDKQVWNRNLQLKVSFDCLDDEEVLPSQEDALNRLLEEWSVVDASLDPVKQYCEVQSAGEVRAKEIDNIFKYVVPKSLFVLRDPSDTIALMCDFKFDLEHGLAIVFKNGKYDCICTQESLM